MRVNKSSIMTKKVIAECWFQWENWSWQVQARKIYNYKWTRGVGWHGELLLWGDEPSNNTLKLRQNGSHFADDLCQCIFVNENMWISVKISLNFVPKGPISNIPALVLIMAWCRPGDKPLSETMMVRLTTHINASVGLNELTHWGRVTHICVGNLCHHWFR